MKNTQQDTQTRVVVLDHFDSFTYNLVTAFERLGATVQVFRTDTDIRKIVDARPTHLVLSPGPGHPRNVHLFERAITCFKSDVPILGVCLGEQAVGLHCSAEVGLAPTPMHGKTSLIFHEGEGLFDGIPSPFQACRYHSLAINPGGIDPKRLTVLAHCNDGTIMAVRSVEYPTVMGVQFHPESLFTEHGERLLANFLQAEKAEATQSSIPWKWRWEGWQTKA